MYRSLIVAASLLFAVPALAAPRSETVYGCQVSQYQLPSQVLLGGPNLKTFKVTCPAATYIQAADKYVVAKYALLNCFRHQKFVNETVVGTDIFGDNISNTASHNIVVQLTVEPVYDDPGNPTACPG